MKKMLYPLTLLHRMHIITFATDAIFNMQFNSIFINSQYYAALTTIYL